MHPDTARRCCASTAHRILIADESTGIPNLSDVEEFSTRTAQTVQALRRVPVFEGLPDDELARVADVAVPRSYPAGQTVFREWDESNTCYIVRSGRARAVREHSDGRSITLAHFGPGNIFGELASASRLLAGLERAGIISQGRGKLVVHDVDALEGYVY